MYTVKNYKTKKELKADLAAGKRVEVYDPGFQTGKTDGKITLEGPHYPQPHRWYAEATIKGRIIVQGSVK